jgi:hypothetical protein
LHELRGRFWLVVAFGAAALVLLLVTVASREWIEEIFGVDPDAHSGALEWLIVAALLVAASASALVARAEWRRAGLHSS